MAEQPAFLRAQMEFAAHIRDPEHRQRPADVEERRMAIYRDLFYNNVEGFVSSGFPVLRSLYEDRAWQRLVRSFFVHHRCKTPYFLEIAQEFLRYLEHEHPTDPADPPFLVELAHYEWVELALQIAECREEDVDADPDGDLLDGTPCLSPLAWPLAYQWPVHRIGPGWQPDPVVDAPTLLLLRRRPDGTVHFSELSPLAYRLVQLLGGTPAPNGGQCLQQLAAEAGVACDDAFRTQGRVLLEQMRMNRVVLGTAR